MCDDHLGGHESGSGRTLASGWWCGGGGAGAGGPPESEAGLQVRTGDHARDSVLAPLAETWSHAGGELICLGAG